MNLFWFLRAKRWAQNPPSARKIKAVAVIVAACVVLYGIEQIWGWPDWLTTNDTRGRLLR